MSYCHIFPKKVVHVYIGTYEVFKAHIEPLDEMDSEVKHEKLTDKEWESTFNYCYQSDKNR